MIEIKRIMEMIPHRYPFLLIDRMTDVVKGESATGIKNVTYNEPHFVGHFPQHPIMPGVLIIEAMAQTSAALVVETLEGRTTGKLVYFTSIENAKFRKPVLPGDTLYLRTKVIKNRGDLWKFDVTADVEGKKVAEAEISAMMMNV